MNQVNKRMDIRRGKKGFKFIRRLGWILASPALFFVIIFGWLPIITAFVIAWQKYNIIWGSQFVGFDNFKYILLKSPIVPVAFRNTIYYSALSLGLTFLVPIFVAILLMEMRKNVIRIMMLLWFIPVASMAGIIIWKYFYHQDYGLFNGILASLGFPKLRWLNDPRLAMICIVLPGLIMYGPGLIYIATLQSIPDELYEAADLEGASFWGKIWHITLPRMRPIIAMMLILSVIGSFQVFDSIKVMTEGGPALATYSIVMQIYDFAFKEFKFGKAGALAIILFFLLMCLIIVQRKYFKENIDR